MSDRLLTLLHLCDSLFPIGAFAYSDGFEAATSRLQPPRPLRRRPSPEPVDRREPDPRDRAVALLREWLDSTLNETVARLEGPVVWSAWRASVDENWSLIALLNEEVAALRPSAAARSSSRAMGLRLLVTWSSLHPDPRLDRALALTRDDGPALPVAFACACAGSGIAQHSAVMAFAYTRLAAVISAAMRLMSVGQTDAHTLLARTLASVPAVIDGIAQRNAPPESFAPLMDIAAMSQQYLHSRLFRS